MKQWSLFLESLKPQEQVLMEAANLEYDRYILIRKRGSGFPGSKVVLAIIDKSDLTEQIRGAIKEIENNPKDGFPEIKGSCLKGTIECNLFTRQNKTIYATDSVFAEDKLGPLLYDAMFVYLHMLNPENSLVPANSLSPDSKQVWQRYSTTLKGATGLTLKKGPPPLDAIRPEQASTYSADSVPSELISWIQNSSKNYFETLFEQVPPEIEPVLDKEIADLVRYVGEDKFMTAYSDFALNPDYNDN